MIVVDASAAIAALTAAGVARGYFQREQVHAPHLIDSEIAHYLRRRVLTEQLSADDGHRLLVAWARVGLTRYPVHGLLGRIWEVRDNLSAYDAGYVALAEALDCPLVTGDGRLARSPGIRCSVLVVPT